MKLRHLALAATGNYVPHAATMLKSLLANTPDAPLCVHFMHDAGFAANQRRLLESMLAAHGATLHCMDLSDGVPASVPLVSHYPAPAWFRVLLPELLPEVERLLYLDVDLVVVDSLAPLWETDLEGNMVAAVTNVYAHEPAMTQALGLPEPSRYFNSGVMLMDLAEMRRERIGEQIFSFATAYPDLVRFADQDPLNALLHGRRLHLPLRYNVQTPCYQPGLPLVVSEAEVVAALASPAVVHFSSQKWKPWHILCDHPMRPLYDRYRRQTPWPRFIPDGATPRLLLMRVLPPPLARFVRRAARMLVPA